MGTLRATERAADNQAISADCGIGGAGTFARAVQGSDRPWIRDRIERRVFVGTIQELECDGADGAGFRRIRGGSAGVDFQRKEIPPDYAHRGANQPGWLWHRYAGAGI